MKHRLAMLFAAALFAMSSSLVTACPDHEGDAKSGATVAHEGKAPCGAKSGEKAPCAKSGSPCHAKATTVASDEPIADERVAAALAKLPKMLYRVGDETTCCEKSAVTLAEKSGKPLQYVIGDEVIEDHCAAEVKLATMLEKELENLAAMKYAVGEEAVGCPVTAKQIAQKKNAAMAYRVAGIDFKDEQQADKAVKLVTDALGAVKMTYKVDGESFCCDKMAGMKAKESGKPVIFVVGSEETSCEKHARLLLMQAKARAAVTAAVTVSAT